MNNFKVEIYNEETELYENYSGHSVFPPKFANLLDEQLDEATITLKRITRDYFNPLTLVRLTLINFPEAKYSATDIADKQAKAETEVNFEAVGNRIKETLETLYVVATDNAIESPAGSGKYNHEIYLIELTKIAEGFIGDSITFTNALGNNYLDD